MTVNTITDEGDTIVAIATAMGQGGIGIVRLSGSKSLSIAKQVLGRQQPLTDVSLQKTGFRESTQPNCLVLRHFYDVEGDLIDQGLWVFFAGPVSFTGEDVVEFQVHGSPVVLNTLLETCLKLGARMAEAGEFSQRAYLNGKVDLTQAEAIADLIACQSRAQAKAILRTLKGDFSKQIDSLCQGIVAVRTEIEARIDFADEALDFLSIENVETSIRSLMETIGHLLTKTTQGISLNEGVQVAIIGAPNAGKSSLLNRLLGYDRAIVSNEQGTTRDTLSEQKLIGGIPFRLLDTAGLRKTNICVEQQGIERTLQAITESDVLLSVHDLSLPLENSPELTHLIPKKLDTAKRIWVMSKSDLLEGDEVVERVKSQNLCSDQQIFVNQSVAVSAKTGEGMASLESLLLSLVKGIDIAASEFAARARHLDALRQSMSYLHASLAQLQESSWDLLAEDLKSAHLYLQQITGTFSSDDLLGEIFSSFCVGK